METTCMQPTPLPEEPAAPPRPISALRRHRGSLLLLALLAAAGLRQLNLPKANVLIAYGNDRDGNAKLLGVRDDAAFGDALGYFAGDDPQRVHTFRPLPALVIWLEFRLWGFHQWPYRLANWLFFLATGWAVVLFCRAMGMPDVPAAAAAVLFMARSTSGSKGVLASVATLHDLFCVLFAVLAGVAALSYLQRPASRTLLAMGAWSLLAYLSKEMAVALLPIGLAFSVLGRWRGASWRTVGACAGVTVLVAVVWLVWYKLAEANMGPSPHWSHSVGGWLTTLAVRWPRPLWFMVSSVCWAAGDIIRLFWAGLGWDFWLYSIFWRSLAVLIGFVTACVILAKRHPSWLACLFIWKVFAFVPVLPFSDTWPWYTYMPHALDTILPVGVVWCWWQEMGGRGWTTERWAAIRLRLPARGQD